MFRYVIGLLSFILLINKGISKYSFFHLNLFGIINFLLGFAIKCYVCSSLHDDRCDDMNFVGGPEFIQDCSDELVYGVIPILHCRKAKYSSNILIAR